MKIYIAFQSNQISIIRLIDLNSFDFTLIELKLESYIYKELPAQELHKLVINNIRW